MFNYRVLLVEDNPSEARLYQEMLADSRMARFEVTGVDRLDAALEQIEQSSYDVILLDLSLPDSNGIQTFRRMCSEAREVPLIVLTGLEDEETASAALQEGAQDYLTKQDFDTRLIERAIRYAIQRKRSEEERLELMREQTARNEQLRVEQAARIEAEKANELKMKFLAMISHELRTPLTSIKGFVTTLLAEDVEWDADSQHQFLQIVDAETDKLTDLVEQLLDLGRLQAGTLRVQLETQPFQAILRQASPQLQVLSREHELRIELDPALPPVQADAQRIAQVLVNLVSNAAKHSPSGTAIHVHAAHNHNGHVQIDVSDQGSGIPAKLRPYVFEAFRQSDDEMMKKRGAGLGLAICKGIIELHNGHIWIADQLTPGTTVSFTLPVATGS